MFRWNDAFIANDDGPKSPRFLVGQRVKHVRYDYRGLIVAMDTRFKASEDWYQKNNTQPNKTQPWYHVLVHGSSSVTYVAETSLKSDPQDIEFRHPLLKLFFDDKKEGFYKRNKNPWPGHL